MSKPGLPLISIVTPCYNEEANVQEVYERVRACMESETAYRYEHIFIDNASTDSTVPLLRQIAADDTNVRLIINTRNFGHIRSPYYALLQARGRAVVLLVSDLQDPPEMLSTFLRKWEAGYPVVVGVKSGSDEAKPMYLVRRIYYELISRFAEIRLVKNFTGFGLYDRKVIRHLRQLHDPYPYFRGAISELGYDIAEIEYHQPLRKRGVTKNNFYTLFDLAMLGMTNHSKVPLRLATLLGFAVGALSLVVGFCYLIAKLVFWNSFALGLAPLVVGMFFLASVQLFFLGIVGEYLGAVYTQISRRPLVVEKERVNFPPRSRRRRSSKPRPE